MSQQERQELEDLQRLDESRSVAPKPKEVDEFKFTNLPTILQFDKWYQALKRKISVGSHDHKLCMRWLAAIDIAPSWESLEYSGVFENLDSKIASALIDI